MPRQKISVFAIDVKARVNFKKANYLNLSSSREWASFCERKTAPQCQLYLAVTEDRDDSSDDDDDDGDDDDDDDEEGGGGGGGGGSIVQPARRGKRRRMASATDSEFSSDGEASQQQQSDHDKMVEQQEEFDVATVKTITIQVLAPIVCVKHEGKKELTYRTATGKYDDVLGEVYVDGSPGNECCRNKLDLDQIANILSYVYKKLDMTKVGETQYNDVHCVQCTVNDTHALQKMSGELTVVRDMFEVKDSDETVVDATNIAYHSNNVYARSGSNGKVTWMNNNAALKKQLRGKQGEQTIALGLGATNSPDHDREKAMLFQSPDDHMTTVIIPAKRGKEEKNKASRAILQKSSDKKDLVNRAMTAAVTKMCDHTHFSYQISSQATRNIAFLLALRVNSCSDNDQAAIKAYLDNPTAAPADPAWGVVVSAAQLEVHTDQSSYEQAFADMVTGWSPGNEEDEDEGETRYGIGKALVIAYGVDTTKADAETAMNAATNKNVTRVSQLRKKGPQGGDGQPTDGMAAAL